MAQTVRELMTETVATIASDASLLEASRIMRDRDIGDVVVVDGDAVRGIVTDRDIVVRAIADEQPPGETPVSAIASTRMTTVSPEDSVKDVVQIMRDHAIRRLPVVESGKPVGIVSIGDLAVERDPNSALAEISAADPNN
jgi:CBS domain-containing protein